MRVEVSASVKRLIRETIDRMMAGASAETIHRLMAGAEAEASEKAFCNVVSALSAGSPGDVKELAAELASLAKLLVMMDTAWAVEHVAYAHEKKHVGQGSHGVCQALDILHSGTPAPRAVCKGCRGLGSIIRFGDNCGRKCPIVLSYTCAAVCGLATGRIT